MSGSDPATLDAEAVAFAGVSGQAELMATGRITAVDLVDLLLARIEAWQPRINPFRALLGSTARIEAAVADAARAGGDTRPLLGVPLAVKDNVAVAGQPAALGTSSPQPVATADGPAVAPFRAAGMVLLGLTHLPELALWAATESEHHGVTRNPWDLRRTPGGSSGGSAAAVAAGLVPVATASDGLGSIRIPASCCGLVGLKPTHGLVPLDDADHWEGMSHAGVLTRSVDDTRLVLQTVLDVDLTHPGGPAELRIATSSSPTTPHPLAPDVRRVLDETVARLAGLGATVTPADPPYGATLAASTSVRYIAGMRRDLDELADSSATEARTRALARLGATTRPGAVLWARDQGLAFAARMTEFFTSYDLLVTPTMPVLPRRAGVLAGRGLVRTLAVMAPCAGFTGPWNASGLPAMSVPAGATADGLPVGVQLVGPRGSEALLLAVGAALETECGWLDRRPAG